MATYKSITQHDGPFWIGWTEEIPGVNAQGATREELLENLRSALEEALKLNRADARGDAKGQFEKAIIPVEAQ